MSELLSLRHRELAAKPPENYDTLAGVPGAPAGGDGPYDPAHPLAITPPPPALPLADPLTLHDLGPALWNLDEHFRQVAERVGKWPVCDWHAIDRVVLSANPQTDGYQLKGNPVLVLGRAPCRRLTVYNQSPFPIALGQGGGSALAGAVAMVPGLSVLVMPWNADDVEVACDPAVVPAGSGLEVPPILLVRSDRETDEITVDRLGNVTPILNPPVGVQAPLPAAGVWIGPTFPMAPGYATLKSVIYSDQAGTGFVDGWIGGAWRVLSTFTVVAATVFFNGGTLTAPWCRLRYVNGATPQTVFEWQAAPSQ